MGREATRGETSPVAAGLEAYELALAVGLTHDVAIMTALGATEQTTRINCLTGTRDNLLWMAEEIDANEELDLNVDGPASLIFAAKVINDVLPPEQQKGYPCQ